MIVFQDEQGLCFWPEELIAAITPAFPNRLRVVTCDGSLGYCPLPMPEGPWLAAGDSQVQPGWLRNNTDAAGFDHGPVPSAPLPDYQPEPYWMLEQTEDGLFWHDDQAAVPCTLPLEEAQKGLIRCGTHRYFHPRRLRRLQDGGKNR